MNDIPVQRWGALGLLVIVILAIVFTVVIPLVSTGMEYHESKNELAFRLQRYQQIAARKEWVEADIKQIKEQYQKQAYFSTHNTVALASADLQKTIKTAITESGAQLTSTQVLSRKKEDELNNVIMKVRMSGNLEQLRSIFYLLETTTPLVIINQLDIRPVRGKRNRKTRKFESSNKLNINFQAISFMRAKSNE